MRGEKIQSSSWWDVRIEFAQKMGFERLLTTFSSAPPHASIRSRGPWAPCFRHLVLLPDYLFRLLQLPSLWCHRTVHQWTLTRSAYYCWAMLKWASPPSSGMYKTPLHPFGFFPDARHLLLASDMFILVASLSVTNNESHSS